MFGEKIFAFVSLLLLQVIVSIVYKYSQKHGKYEYSPLATISCSEAIKFFLSLILLINSYRKLDTSDQFSGYVTKQISTYFLLNSCLLALLYCVNNQLAFQLFLSVDPASISLFKSLSSFECAVLLWTFFDRQINQIQWSSICLQVLGLIIVQYDTCHHSALFQMKFYFMLILSSLITALSSVLNEYFIKAYSVNINLQNLVLYLFGFCLNFTLFYFIPNLDGHGNKSFFQGYTLMVIAVITCNSFLGITITFVYKYADAIVKTFSTACATAVLLFFNLTLFHSYATLTSFLGAAIIFISSYVYFAATTNSTAIKVEAQENSKTTSPKSKLIMKWIIYLTSIFVFICSVLYFFVPIRRYYFKT
ncbi:unnamed protein product [Adineta ricciae]|uniref:Uncharacterized protein n=1 Tax=Adineta ricciae TaxID=249248 RepID=A0A815GLX0_ADIRI|nr:unnamed protein product [Adineta ricciae]CAF1552464.1 unnamed protein product [Adineta ricciae]